MERHSSDREFGFLWNQNSTELRNHGKGALKYVFYYNSEETHSLDEQWALNVAFDKKNNILRNFQFLPVYINFMCKNFV